MQTPLLTCYVVGTSMLITTDQRYVPKRISWSKFEGNECPTKNIHLWGKYILKKILNSHIQNSAFNAEIYFNVSLILQAKLLF